MLLDPGLLTASTFTGCNQSCLLTLLHRHVFCACVCACSYEERLDAFFDNARVFADLVKADGVRSSLNQTTHITCLSCYRSFCTGTRARGPQRLLLLPAAKPKTLVLLSSRLVMC